MSRTTRVLFVVLSAFFAVWSTAALTGAAVIRHSWAGLGISYPMGTAIASLEMTAAVGLMGGLRWPRLGFAAASGLVAMMTGATFAHLRAYDIWGAHGSVVVGLISLGAVASVVADLRSSSSDPARREFWPAPADHLAAPFSPVAVRVGGGPTVPISQQIDEPVRVLILHGI